jgi:hypothetical protein
VGGGVHNEATDTGAAIAGGRENTAGYDAAVGGGYGNNASGSRATVPGGELNTASGHTSFAAGRRAQAVHVGAFVWADNQDADFNSTGANDFILRAQGGVGINTNDPTRILTLRQGGGNAIADGWDTYSSRRWKEDVAPIEGALDQVLRLRGVTYAWKATGDRDVGLIAEEVGLVVPEVVTYEANGVDAQSVDYARLVAVLIEGVKEQQRTIDAQQERLDRLEGLMERLAVEDAHPIAVSAAPVEPAPAAPTGPLDAIANAIGSVAGFLGGLLR